MFEFTTVHPKTGARLPGPFKPLQMFEVYDLNTAQFLGGGNWRGDPDTTFVKANEWAERNWPNREVHVELVSSLF